MRMLIAGGGTGGHLFPGLALAEEVKTRHPRNDVLFVGTQRGLEMRVVPKSGFALETIDVGPLKRQGGLGLLRGLGRIPRSLWQSRRILRRFDPDVVVGVGGYASGPVVLAAYLMGIPTAVLFCVAFALLFVAGAGLRHLAICAAVAAPVGVFLVWHSRYRLDRMLAFLDPWADPRGRGYQAVESLLAFGAGGGFGVGLGASSQKLFFLPAAHNDFILSIIGEELGFAGVAAVLVLFAVLVWRGIRAAHAAADAEACFVALGLTFLLAAQVLVNAGMALSLLPTKGMALPFLSYGISSVVSSSLAAGILLSVSGGAGGFLRRPVGGRR